MAAHVKYRQYDDFIVDDPIGDRIGEAPAECESHILVACLVEQRIRLQGHDDATHFVQKFVAQASALRLVPTRGVQEIQFGSRPNPNPVFHSRRFSSANTSSTGLPRLPSSAKVASRRSISARCHSGKGNESAIEARLSQIRSMRSNRSATLNCAKSGALGSDAMRSTLVLRDSSCKWCRRIFLAGSRLSLHARMSRVSRDLWRRTGCRGQCFQQRRTCCFTRLAVSVTSSAGSRVGPFAIHLPSASWRSGRRTTPDGRRYLESETLFQ